MAIMKHAAAYWNGSKRRNLCLEEELMIMKGDKTKLLNKRTESFSKYGHKSKFHLDNVYEKNKT